LRPPFVWGLFKARREITRAPKKELRKKGDSDLVEERRKRTRNTKVAKKEKPKKAHKSQKSTSGGGWKRVHRNEKKTGKNKKVKVQ